VELDEKQSIQLCLSPLLVYTLVRGNPLHSGPRGEWQLLRALEEGLTGSDPLSITLVEGLKNNLHKFFAYFCQHYANATADELLVALGAARRILDDLARNGSDPAGFLQSLERFTDVLAEREKDAGDYAEIRKLLT